jgi:hypothetical protein
VADLSAENARLKQPVTPHEFSSACDHNVGGKKMATDGITIFNRVLASRSKEPKAGPCSVCGDSDGKGYCPIHNPEEPKGATR